jgi:hypothetical protein
MTVVTPESGLFAAVNENDELAVRELETREPRTAHSQEVEEEEGCENTVAWNLNAGDLQTVYIPVRPGKR